MCRLFTDLTLGKTVHVLLSVNFHPYSPLVRIVSWGHPMSDNGLSFLKAIGIRVHTVRYQKIRKRIQKDDAERDDIDVTTSSGLFADPPGIFSQVGIKPIT